MVKFRLVSGHFSKWERGENGQPKKLNQQEKEDNKLTKKQKNKLSVDIWSRKKGKKNATVVYNCR